MTQIVQGRHTARVPGDGVVVFLIGARVNRLRSLPKFGRVLNSMGTMLGELAADPDHGLLHSEQFRRGRTVLLVQYWRSHEDLQAFATQKGGTHVAAWQEFNRLARESDGAGVYHETYVVQPGQAEAIYSNVPSMLLGAALGTQPVGPRTERAGDRLTAA